MTTDRPLNSTTSDPQRHVVYLHVADLRRWSHTYTSGGVMCETELWVDAERIDRRVEIKVVDAPDLDGLYVVDDAPNGVLRLTKHEPQL